MEQVGIEIGATQKRSSDPLPFSRSYQLEALEKAINGNTIAFLETGSGKTLIAVMLLRSCAYLLRKPSRFFAVFLVPKVVLVTQQAQVVRTHTDLIVGQYWGEMGIDYWRAADWEKEIEKHEVLVMTPAILLASLRHSFLKMNMIKVLIFDECHHASGNDPYACIMREFYHPNFKSKICNLPRIFGMTASPINTKGAKTDDSYWRKISTLETLMNSKVFTCADESVLAEYISFSTPTFKFYRENESPVNLGAQIEEKLDVLKVKHLQSLSELNLNASSVESTKKRIAKIHSTLLYCVAELGLWLALKAAQFFSTCEIDLLSWGNLDKFGERITKSFGFDAAQALETYMPSEWTISGNIEVDVESGLFTTKIVCLIESLLDYKNKEDIRCIIFVERVITAVVLQSLLSVFLPIYISWKTKYIAGNNSGVQCQTRKKQNEIVEEFREGLVNIIVATSILEEGLDVQSCNLVIRFDPSATVCSFIQSRGRARMQNSDYLLMVKSGDESTLGRLQNYLSSGCIMRKESIRHASDPCCPLEDGLDDESYSVPSTGAIVTLSSSVSLIYFYCSRLPSDGYFKPAPRCDINKITGTCTLRLPNSCPVQTVSVQGDIKNLKQRACLEACRQLHEAGCLTDHLVPGILDEEADAQQIVKEPYNDDQPVFFPADLVLHTSDTSKIKYYCYIIELNQKFDYEVPVENVVLALRGWLEPDILNTVCELEANRGTMTVNFKALGTIQLSPEQVLSCRKFQIKLLRVLLDHKVDRLQEVLDLDGLKLGDDRIIDYLLLPSTGGKLINWEAVKSGAFSFDNALEGHVCNEDIVQTESGRVCACLLKNSLVYTPHNGHVYCTTGILNGLNENSLLKQRDGSRITYKNYYRLRHGICLRSGKTLFVKGKHIFHVQNYLQRRRNQKEKESRFTSVELPPELCRVIMYPISISTIYSFSFVPSIMHRIETLLLATNLKKLHLDNGMQNVVIPTSKILEAITTKKCQEKFHLESLETLGDSFLKYAACQQLFKTYENHHEGLLSIKKDRIVSNVALCKLGVERKLPGFIRTEVFEPKSWMIPGDNSSTFAMDEESLSDEIRVYVSGRRKVKSKTVADVVEALIGAYLSTGGESAALLYLDWVGVPVDLINCPYKRQFEVDAARLVNLQYFETLLNYSFQDPSLLVEALTHGSYMLPEIPRCYQRLEFLGDSVLDYLITRHLYNKFPGMSPGLLTDMRSASVNNDCYAYAAVKASLHKHVLHASHDLHKHINETLKNFSESSSECTFGWDFETSFPKVLGDVIESLAGAIFVDSGFNKEAVFLSIRPLLEPLVTPETVRIQPVRELTELCQREQFDMKKPVKTHYKGIASITVEVEANGKLYQCTQTAKDKKTAKKLACKGVLQELKQSLSGT